MGDVKRDLEKDWTSRPINTLCRTGKKGKIEFLFCKPAIPLESIMAEFGTMAGENSDIFQKIWRKNLSSLTKHVTSATEVTFETIVENLWKPTFEECKLLLDNLRDRTILLSDVKSYFFEYCGDSSDQTLTCKLSNFYACVEMCVTKCRPSECHPWLKAAIQLIVQYWKLRHDIQAAEVILKAKEQLQVKGDFQLIRSLATKVCFDCIVGYSSHQKKINTQLRLL